ncbi:MAG: hypothetical protein K5Q68_22065 [Roseococcus sp.]|nr:hypothetical protein [Roseococcus sp.]
MNTPFSWPKDADEIADAQANINHLVAFSTHDEIARVMAAVDDACQGEPVTTVILALAAKLGMVVGQTHGPRSDAAFAPVAIAVQLSWDTAARNTPKH